MKRSLIFSMIFSILILTACLSPSGGVSAPTVTATKAAPTATKTATATETPSPESLLPQEVKEKFELAGIDPANMENTEYDKDGLHITLPSGEVIVLTNTELQKGIYNGQDNVLQYRDEANQNVIYAFNKESGKWVTTELTSEEQLTANMELLKLSGTPETNADGDTILRDEAGKIIYRDGWMGDEIEDLIANAGICQPTEYLVDPNGEFPNSPFKGQRQALINYAIGLVKKIGHTDSFQAINPGPIVGEDGVLRYDILREPLKNTSQCWLIFISPNDPKGPINFVTFETNDGVVGLPLSQE